MIQNQEIVKWMKMETQFLAEQNQPERFAELIQSIKPLVGNGYDLQVDDFDIPFTLDRECLELIYSQISLDETELRVNYSNPLGYTKGNNQITINAIDMKNLSGNYRSPAHLYHAIQVHLLGRSDLINVVRDSSKPFKDSYIKRSGKVDSELYSAWKDIKVDVAFKVNRLKFIQSPELARALLETGKMKLVSTYNPIWGYDKDLNGSNVNGKMLMIIREDLLRRI